MRWDTLRLTDNEVVTPPGGRIPLLPRGAVTRQFDTPEFRGITFHEVTARSALNKVPEASQMPFRWTINPYRGCSHACTYCAHGDTLVLMADGRAKRLADVRPGDRVIGTEVRGRYRRYVVTDVRDHWQTGSKRAYRLRLANGTTLVASGDHRFLTESGWKHVTGAMSGALQRAYLTTSDSLLGFGAMVEPPKHDDDYRLGYLAGMIRGDRHFAPYRDRRVLTSPKFRLALVGVEALDRSSRFLAELGVATSWRPFGPDKPNYRQMTAISNQTKRGDDTVQALISWPSHPSEQWERGFLAGIFDAVGTHSSRGLLRIANTDPVVIEATARALRLLDVPHTVERCRCANGLMNVRVTGGLSSRMRFLQLTDPATTRKRDISGMAIKSDVDLRVTAIEDLGVDVAMYDITTGTGDFIANGVVSHNCFARKTHEYLELDAGHDFDSQIVVKTNVGEVLRRELARPSWRGEHVAMGTNVDCYQRAEGRYRLMPPILEALRDAANPFSILTKGALILHDLPLLEQAADVTDVSAAVSVGFLDEEVWRSVEPGTPPPQRRLAVARTLNEAGISCGVLMAPILPYLTDSDAQLEATVAAVAASGATYVSPIVLHLRPGAREWWQAWLRREHPDLLPRYQALYGDRSNAPKGYQHEITEKVRAFADRYGVGRSNVLRRRTGHERAKLARANAPTERPDHSVQLELLPAPMAGAHPSTTVRSAGGRPRRQNSSR
jgi:DNA repair photolyase